MPNDKEFSVGGLLEHKPDVMLQLLALNLVVQRRIRIQWHMSLTVPKQALSLTFWDQSKKYTGWGQITPLSYTYTSWQIAAQSQMTKNPVVCWSINQILCCIYWPPTYWHRGGSEYTCKDWSSHCHRILDQKPHYIQQSQDKFGNPKLCLSLHTLLHYSQQLIRVVVLFNESSLIWWNLRKMFSKWKCCGKGFQGV